MDVSKKIWLSVLVVVCSSFVFIKSYKPKVKNLPVTSAIQIDDEIGKIKKQITDNKYSDASISLRRALAQYPSNTQLLNLQKQLVIADYKKSVKTVNSSLVFDKAVNIAKCFEGVLNVSTQKQLIDRINYVRRLAGVYDSCVLDPELNKKAQSTAYLMEVNDRLSHAPTSNWKCYTKEAAATAGKSNLSLGYSFMDALMGQIKDDGAGNAACGHRRWILNPTNNVFGHGSTNEAMCLYTVNTYNKALSKTINFPDSQFIAWPSAENFPIDLMPTRWSFSYQNADFNQAKVEVNANSKAIKIQKESIEVGYAINTLVFKLNQTVVANTTYNVKISNIKVFNKSTGKYQLKTISYRVIPISID